MYDRSAVTPLILERISNGESLRAICATEGMPHRDTVNAWLAEDKTFSDQYARAHVEQADYWMDRIVEVVGERPPLVTDTNHKAGGGEGATGRMDSAFVAWKRLQADKYQWFASKLNAKKYGDKVDMQHMGADGGPIQITRVERVIVRTPD